MDLLQWTSIFVDVCVLLQVSYSNKLGLSSLVFVARSSDTHGSCDLVLEAMMDGLTKWDGIAMEINQIDYHYSYKLLSTLLELASLLLEVCLYDCRDIMYLW